VLLSDATFHEPATLEEASELMARFGAQARPLAGGTDVLVDVKRGRFRAAHVVSLNRIASLRGVVPEQNESRIGALTSVNQLADSAIVRERFPAILDATRKMAGPQVRNMATVGGNLCNANRCADLPPIFMVMAARVVLWSRAEQRNLPLESFFIGEQQTAVRSGEILTQVVIPYPPQGYGAAFARVGLRASNAIAVAGAAAGLVLDAEGIVRDARIAVSAVAPTPKLIEKAAALLTGQPLDEVSLNRAAAAAVDACDAITDIRAQADYRRVLVGSLTRAALVTAHERAQRDRRSRQEQRAIAGRELELS
jgi:carbon-monoxide dehydrogenase medium subunit